MGDKWQWKFMHDLSPEDRGKVLALSSEIQTLEAQLKESEAEIESIGKIDGICERVGSSKYYRLSRDEMWEANIELEVELNTTKDALKAIIKEPFGNRKQLVASFLRMKGLADSALQAIRPTQNVETSSKEAE